MFAPAITKRFFSHVQMLHKEKNVACWLWHNVRGKTLPRDKYGMFYVEGKFVVAHVYSWRLANRGARVPRGKVVKHSCDVKRCVNPNHLELGTRGQNAREAFARKRHARCEAVLDRDAVVAVRRLLKRYAKLMKEARNISPVALARRFRVGRSTINRIKSGQYTPYTRKEIQGCHATRTRSR